MSLSFKFIPLTFLSDENEIKKQIRNTIILKYFFERNSETVHLEDLITGTQYGYNASALVHGRNKFLRISDITDGKVNWEKVPYCNCTDEETYLLSPNDILIARTGGTTGKSFLISQPPALSIYAGYLIRIRANEDTNPDYLNLFLNSYVYWSQIVSLNEDNFRPSVNANKLKKLILPKCDFKTQVDIVKISNGEFIKGYENLYSLLDDTLIKYEKLRLIQKEKKLQLDYYNELNKSIIQDAISGVLTSEWRLLNEKKYSVKELITSIKKQKNDKENKRQKDTFISSIESINSSLPEEWINVKLDDLVMFTNGKAHEQFIDNGGDYILVNSKFVSTNGNEKKHTNKQLTPLYINDIAIVMSDVPNGRALSRCFLVDLDNKYTLNQRIGSLTPLVGVYPKYLKMVIDRNNHFLRFNDGKKQTNLKKEQVLSCPIPFCSTEEQIVIVDKVEELMKKTTQLKNEILRGEVEAVKLMGAILKDSFNINSLTESLDTLFADVNYSLYLAMIHKQIENRLKINYGEVATQKTVFNINAFTDQKIPYNFINSNHGTFSPQLKEDLSKNSYLAKDRKGNGEVFIINPSKQKEVLDALSNPKNKFFVRAVNKVLDIYELPFINKETDKIELLNTVAKLIIDTKSTDLKIIYASMQKWEIKQNGFKTKAEKFSKPLTKKMIALIENLRLVDKLTKVV